jgi:uncharacterized protein with HEPN domain
MLLEDIIENADSIARYLAGLDFDDFTADQMRIDAVERCLMRLTEAAIRIGPDRMTEIAPELPMRQVRGLGNVLRHAYELIDLRTIWDTAVTSVPVLREACAAVLAAGNGN